MSSMNGRIVRRVELGVPLHGEHVGRPGVADRLDDAVGLRARLDDQVAAEVLHRLVVDRVGLDERRARIERGRGRVPGTNDVAWQFSS